MHESEGENKRWFSIESKSFTLSKEGKEKSMKYVVMECSKGAKTPILLEELSSGRKMEILSSSLVRQITHNIGRFILVKVSDLEQRRDNLYFLEGKGQLNGWILLGEKLRSLGVCLNQEVKIIRREPRSDL